MKKQRRFDWSGPSDLERYGLLALAASLVLGVAYLAQALTSEELRRDAPAFVGALGEPEATADLAAAADAADERDEPATDDDAVAHAASAPPRDDGRMVIRDVARDEPGGGLVTPAPRGLREDFDFFEPPVRLPGRPAVLAPPAPGADATARQVVVKRGDTLQKIAARELGDAKSWKTLVEWNPGLDPKRLQTGAKLKLPPVARAAPETRKAAARTHVVAADETLRSIARKYWGDEERWIDLLEANRAQLPTPASLRVGMKLEIP